MPVEQTYDMADIPQLVNICITKIEALSNQEFSDFETFIDESGKIVSRELVLYEDKLQITPVNWGSEVRLSFYERFYEALHIEADYCQKKVTLFYLENNEPANGNLLENPFVWNQYFNELKTIYFSLPNPHLKSLFIKFLSRNIYTTGDPEVTDDCIILLSEFKNEIRDGVNSNSFRVEQRIGNNSDIPEIISQIPPLKDIWEILTSSKTKEFSFKKNEEGISEEERVRTALYEADVQYMPIGTGRQKYQLPSIIATYILPLNTKWDISYWAQLICFGKPDKETIIKKAKAISSAKDRAKKKGLIT